MGGNLSRKARISFLLLLLTGARSAAALEVPLRVQELVPRNVAGSTRHAEPVSVGVPIGPTDGISDPQELGLVGAQAAQFRALHRDPETNALRWVLVDFLADVPGGSYTLVRGTGNFGGSDLAHESANRIVVSTGAARFEIRTDGFNVLDRVLLGTDEIVATHPGGGVVLFWRGIRYESGLDPETEVEIEENGPVRAVVRARGRLVNKLGTSSLGYTARLHFYKDQTSCRAFVTLRNADLVSLEPGLFDAAWVEIPLRLDGDREVRFGFQDGVFAGPLEPGARAHLFQGDNTFQRGRRTGRITPDLTPSQGLELQIAGAEHNSLGQTSDVARGWIRIQNGKHAVLAGMRDLATLFPSGFDVRDDLLAVEMFSRHNPQQDLVFSWGAHETREILFEFGTPASDSDAFHRKLQHPLLGRCDFERYRDTGAIRGERRLVTADEQRLFFADQGHRWSPEDYAEKDLELERQFSFSTSGGGNQFDQDECELLDFLRTGFAGRFMQARHGVLWKADQAVLHSDDFDYGLRQNGISDISIPRPKTFHGKGAGSLFDDEHPHWVSMPLYYYLTGDERVREAIGEYGEWRRYRAGHPVYGAIHGGALKHFRLWSRCLRDVALLYEFTGEPRYLEDVRRMARALTTTIEDGLNRGRNLERGYFYFGNGDDPRKRIHLFFLIEMNAIGVHEATRVLPREDPLREELRDYLHGLAYFTLQEAQIAPDAIGYPYGYYAEVSNTSTGKRGDQTGLVLTHGFEMSGDREFVRRARDLAWRVPSYQHWLRGSELSTHVRIHAWLHRDEIGAALLDPSARRNEDGSYTLTWTAPRDAKTYIAKYGSRRMVENLGFDQETRTFAVDPAHAMNFWAASNLPGEPEPGVAGTHESFTTPPLPDGDWFFKIKVLASSPIHVLPNGGLPAGDLETPTDEPGADPAPEPGVPSQGNSGAPVPTDAVARKESTSILDIVGSISSFESSVGGVRFMHLPADSVVRVYSVAGRLVRKLASSPGRDLVWDLRTRSGTRVAPGVYLCRVDSRSNGTQHGRLVLIR